MTRKIILAALAVLLAWCAGKALAAGPTALPQGPAATPAYRPDNSPVAAYANGVAAVQTSGLAAVLADDVTWPEFQIGGRQNLRINAEFSKSADSCGLTVFYLFTGTDSAGATVTDGLRGIETFTVTAGASQNSALEYLATSVRDTFGATHVKVAVTTAPATGADVDLFLGAY